MPKPPRIYIVGRESNHSRAQIRVPRREDSVSREHLEITVTDDGRCYINDLRSSNGTFRKVRGDWQPVRQTYVELDTPLRLGDFRTSARELLAMAPPPPREEPPPLPKEKAAEPPSPPKPDDGPMLDPETGEIIR